MDIKSFEEKIYKLINIPGKELSGLSLAITDSEKLIYHKGWGRRYIDISCRDNDLPMTSSTLCRVASISKTVCAMAALIMEEQGILDFQRDLSDYLGFPLRNPRFPHEIITTDHIFTHTSSLRDGTEYYIPKNRHIKSLVTGLESEINWSRTRGPQSRYFEYCNLGYTLMATVLEIVSGKNYHILVQELILDPLLRALGEPYNRASFSLQTFTDQEIGNLAVLYRKWDENNPADSPADHGWVAQCDSPESVRMIRDDLSLYSGYVTGTNGTLFSPQGGMRASAITLSGLIRLFLGKGKINGTEIIPEKVFDKMLTVHWRFNPEEFPEYTTWPFTRASGYGIFKITNEKDSYGSDRFLPQGGPECWGHHADAYGLKGAMFFDREKKLGFSYLITGTSTDPELERGKWSSFSLLEETLTSLMVEHFC